MNLIASILFLLCLTASAVVLPPETNTAVAFAWNPAPNAVEYFALWGSATNEDSITNEQDFDTNCTGIITNLVEGSVIEFWGIDATNGGGFWAEDTWPEPASRFYQYPYIITNFNWITDVYETHDFQSFNLIATTLYFCTRCDQPFDFYYFVTVDPLQPQLESPIQ